MLCGPHICRCMMIHGNRMTWPELPSVCLLLPLRPREPSAQVVPGTQGGPLCPEPPRLSPSGFWLTCSFVLLSPFWSSRFQSLVFLRLCVSWSCLGLCGLSPCCNCGLQTPSGHCPTVLCLQIQPRNQPRGLSVTAQLRPISING